jgi:hypothetical protein
MSDSTITSVSFPIPHDPNDKRPLPEIIANYCGFPLASKPVGDKQYYAVQDWIAGVAQPASHPGTFWTHMKSRAKKAGIEFSSWCTKLPYTASDGKNYKVDFAEAETLYRITQRMDANTGIREAILHFLARAGVVVDEFRIDPEKALEAVIAAYKRMGKSDEWIDTRLRSKVRRVLFTASFQRVLNFQPQPLHFAVITDEMRLGLWKRNTRTLKAQIGLKKNDNLRDNLSRIALDYEMLTESISTYDLDQHHDLTLNQATRIVRSRSESVGKHAEETGRSLGIDIPTGRPLLSDKSEK